MKNTEERSLVNRVEKVFFSSGDVVVMKHSIPNRPKMVVQSIDKIPVTTGDRVALLGVTCIWFSTDHKLQKSRFSTKDIKKVTDD